MRRFQSYLQNISNIFNEQLQGSKYLLPSPDNKGEFIQGLTERKDKIKNELRLSALNSEFGSCVSVSQGNESQEFNMN